jgi:CDP-glycerol glycerophosphotransferase (TagB/SpsB family)
MRFQVLADKHYHRACIQPAAEELKKRGQSVTFSDRTIASVGYLDRGFEKKLKRPIFFMPHGVAVVKTTLYKELTKADYTLMTGPIWKERMEYLFPEFKNNIGAGFPKSDELVNGKNTRDQVIKEFGLDPKEPVVIFAPSWDDPDAKRKGTIDALSDIERLGLKNLLVCVHEYDKTFKTLAGKHIIKAPNKNRYLLAADLLIGDISSIMIEFALLNKPMVQIDMFGDRRMYGIWEDPTYHYGTFQIGEFAAPDALDKAVEAALSDPNKYEYLRKYWVWRSFYNIGKASISAADSIEKLTASYSPARRKFFFF